MDAPSPQPSRPVRSRAMTRSYVLVMVFWALTLIALYAFQEYFA